MRSSSYCIVAGTGWTHCFLLFVSFLLIVLDRTRVKCFSFYKLILFGWKKHIFSVSKWMELDLEKNKWNICLKYRGIQVNLDKIKNIWSIICNFIVLLYLISLIPEFYSLNCTWHVKKNKKERHMHYYTVNVYCEYTGYTVSSIKAEHWKLLDLAM